MNGLVRVGVCADFHEEGWPSMDRVADRLLESLSRSHAATVAAAPVCPPFRRRATKMWSGRTAWNVDRGLNRHIDYPRHVRTLATTYDVFHVVDHSYSQLVHQLPARRTVVTCHDLDTFRSILEPVEERRSPFFRAMARQILSGLQRAGCVTCDTAAVRDELIAHQLVPGERIVVAPVGVSDEFRPSADEHADREAARLVGSSDDGIEILHVGSSVPRKRLDIVLQCCADLRARFPNLRLVRVGGPLTAEQEALAHVLGVHAHMRSLPALDDRILAAVYRRAALLVLPSAREGFGFPIVEAFACGTPVVASDLPVLREVGGAVASFCPVGDRDEWARTVSTVIRERIDDPQRASERRTRALAWARRFTWARFGDQLATIYLELARATEAAREPRFETCPA